MRVQRSFNEQDTMEREADIGQEIDERKFKGKYIIPHKALERRGLVGANDGSNDSGGDSNRHVGSSNPSLEMDREAQRFRSRQND